MPVENRPIYSESNVKLYYNLGQNYDMVVPLLRNTRSGEVSVTFCYTIQYWTSQLYQAKSF